MADNSDEVLVDLSPIFKTYKSGRIERLAGSDTVPPSLDPATGVQSKDVQISLEVNLSARLYLPPNADRSKKLPLLAYFHGGAFVIGSAFSSCYQKHLNHLVARTNAVAVSVNYRLAPEFPLPAAFEDCWHALRWIGECKEEWIDEFADLNRLYLGGDSAGANIAHNAAMRVGSEKPGGFGFNLRGIFLNCPYFGGVDPIGDETAEPFKYWNDLTVKMWRFVSSDLDAPWINPSKDPEISRLGCRKVLIHVGGKDFLKHRGLLYKEVLVKSGWDGEVECVEVEDEEHVFSVFSPESRNGVAMLEKVSSLING